MQVQERLALRTAPCPTLSKGIFTMGPQGAGECPGADELCQLHRDFWSSASVAALSPPSVCLQRQLSKGRWCRLVSGPFFLFPIFPAGQWAADFSCQAPECENVKGRAFLGDSHVRAEPLARLTMSPQPRVASVQAIAWEPCQQGGLVTTYCQIPALRRSDPGVRDISSCLPSCASPGAFTCVGTTCR